MKKWKIVFLVVIIIVLGLLDTGIKHSLLLVHAQKDAAKENNKENILIKIASLIKNFFEQKVISYDVKELSIKDKKDDFKADEKPEFDIDIKDSRGNLVTRLAAGDSGEKTIKVKLRKPNGEEAILGDEVKETATGFKIKLDKGKEFRPGLYKLTVETIVNGITVTQEQNFTWGVLAINVNKSIYLPNEDSFIGIGYDYITANQSGKLAVSNVFSVTAANATVDAAAKDCSEFLRTDNGMYYCEDDEKFYSCKGFENIDTGNEDIGDLTRCKEAKLLRDTVDKSMCPFRHKGCNVTVDMDKGWGRAQSDEKNNHKLSTFHESYQCLEGHCEVPFYFKSNISLEGNLTFDAAAYLELRNISVERALQEGVKELGFLASG